MASSTRNRQAERDGIAHLSAVVRQQKEGFTLARSPLPNIEREEAFTLPELQRRFKISSPTIRKLIADGTFKAVRLGADRSSKLIVSARSVYKWLEGVQYPAEPLPTPIALTEPREIIALSAIPYMTQEERVEIEMRRESGELVVTYIDKLPALVPADRVA